MKFLEAVFALVMLIFVVPAAPGAVADADPLPGRPVDPPAERNTMNLLTDNGFSWRILKDDGTPLARSEQVYQTQDALMADLIALKQWLDTPPTATLASSPATIQPGQNATLTWTTTNAQAVALNGAPFPPSGSMTVSPAVTTTYTLIANGIGGTAQTSVTVTVQQPATTAIFIANPPSIQAGQPSVLSWTTTNAVTVNLNGGAVPLNGSQSVSPAVTTTYILTASGPGGTVTAPVTVTVIPIPTGPPPTFTLADPAPRTALGTPVTLSWTSTGAAHVYVTGDLPQGAINYPWSEVALSGSLTVTPTGSRTYFFRAVSPTGVEAEFPCPVTVTEIVPTPPWDGTTLLAPVGSAYACAGAPDFCANPTVSSIKDGNWSDPMTWSTAVLPISGDVVRVLHHVTCDVHSNSPLAGLGISGGGVLTFRPDVKTRLTAVNVIVYADGALEMGTDAAPVQAATTASLCLQDTPFHPKDVNQWGNAFIVLGRFTARGPVATPWVRLGAEAKAGDESLTLSSPITGWQEADKLMLPDSRQLLTASANNPASTLEVVLVRSASPDGLTVNLAAPLLYDHLGARDLTSGNLLFLPHAGHLTRSIGVRSADPLSPTRAHAFVAETATLDVNGVAFHGLGRTTKDPYGPTNLPDRNPLGLHNLRGPSGGISGYQWRLLNCSLFDTHPVVPASNVRWGLAVSNSFYGLAQGNVIFNWGGAGVCFPEPNASYNVVDSNFVVKVQGGGERADHRQDAGDFGFDGAGFWFRNYNNHVTNNVAAGCGSYGYVLGRIDADAALVPATPGAAPSVTVDLKVMAILDFTGNEAYGTQGLTLWYHGVQDAVTFNDGIPVGTIKSLKAWHPVNPNGSAYSIYCYYVRNVTFDGYAAVGDPGPLSNPNESVSAAFFNDYPAQDVTFVNGSVQGFSTGLGSPSYAKGTFTVRGYFLNNLVNVTDMTQAAPGSMTDSTQLPPKLLVLDTVTYGTFPGAPNPNLPRWNIMMKSGLSGNCANFIVLDQVQVRAHDGVVGDDFQVFYDEQDAGAILPQTQGTNVIGSPDAGQTNAWNWTNHGIATAGAVTPATATTRSDVKGKVVKAGS